MGAGHSVGMVAVGRGTVWERSVRVSVGGGGARIQRGEERRAREDVEADGRDGGAAAAEMPVGPKAGEGAVVAAGSGVSMA